MNKILHYIKDNYKKLFIKEVVIIFIITRFFIFFTAEISSKIYPEYIYKKSEYTAYQLQDYKGNETYFLNIAGALNLKNFINLDEWRQFDAIHYERLVVNGYDDYKLYENHPAANWPFLPFYPGLVRLSWEPLSKYLSVNTVGIILSNIFFYFGLIFVFRFCKDKYNKKVANNTVWFLSIFPSTYFFSAFYTESLYLLIVASSFYYLNKGNYLKSAIIGSIGAITRITAIFLPIVYLWEIFKKNKYKITETIKKRELYYIFIFPALLLIYLLYINNLTGSFLSPFKEQMNWGRTTFSTPIYPIIEYLKEPYLHIPWDLGLITVIILTLTFYLIYQVFRKMGLGYGIFSLLSLSLPLLSGFAGMNRFILSILPVFIAMGILTEGKNWLYNVLTVFFLMMLCIYLFSFVNGYFFTM